MTYEIINVLTGNTCWSAETEEEIREMAEGVLFPHVILEFDAEGMAIGDLESP